jgi:hypothetical protein
LDYEAHKNRKNYFVRAQYHLGYEEPGVGSILQTWLDGGQNIDPNMRTISIEMTGYDYENRVNFPSKQKIANTLSVVWALMRRYNITANNIFGHNEVQLNKPDPGKKFMAFMRLLIGAKTIKSSAGPLGVTISLGVAVAQGRGDTLARLLDRADRGLLDAKRQGRNRVVAISDPSTADQAEETAPR